MSRKILVIDDQRFVTRLLSHILEGAGYDVLIANSGQEALLLLRDDVPALVICDIMMPNADGFEVISNIRADARLKLVPIVVLTARSQHSDIEAARQAGANEYLTKPFSSQQVLECVRRYLS